MHHERRRKDPQEATQAVLKHSWVLHTAFARLARWFPDKTEEDHESGFGYADRMP